MITFSPLSRRATRGFTLIELMVSMTILVLIVSLFAQVANGISTAWRRSEAKMDNFAKARSLLNRFQTDIDGIVQRDDLAAFPSTGDTPDLAFFTLRRGFDVAGAAANTRPLSYIKFDSSGSDAKLMRNDVSFDFTTASNIFADPPAVVTTGSPALPVSVPPGLAGTGFEISDGILAFKWAFLTDEGKYSSTYYSAGPPVHRAIGITISMVVADDRAVRGLEATNKLNAVISDLANEYEAPGVAPGTQNWNPQKKWEDALGLHPGASGSIIGSIGSSRFVQNVRVFQRTYLFPTNRL